MDVVSSDRYIEVKGNSNDEPGFINFGCENEKALQKYESYWLYVVYNIEKGPAKLMILEKNEINKRKEPHTDFWVSFKKDDFDKSITLSEEHRKVL